MDDNFCLLKTLNIRLFLQHIDKFHPNINFTVVVENDNSSPFLDVLISKNANLFSTALYRKETFTGFNTDFSSLSPIKCKFNPVSVLVYRAFHNCFSYENFIMNSERLKPSLVITAFLNPWLIG